MKMHEDKREESMQEKQKTILWIAIGVVILVLVCVVDACLLSTEAPEAGNTETYSSELTDAPHTDSDEESGTNEPWLDTEEPTEPPHEHTYTESITQEATCTEAGEKTFACDCGDTYTETIDAKGHSYGEYVFDNNATYVADGTETAVCICGQTVTRTVEGTMLQYTYTDLTKTMYAKTAVNVRSLPSTLGNVLGTLSKEQEVTITGQCNETGWYRIAYNGSVGYVSNNYVTTQRPKTEEELEAQRQEYVNMYLATDGVKNLFAAMEDDIAKMEAEYQNFVTMSAADPDNTLLSEGVKEIAGYLAQAKEIMKYDYRNLDPSKALDPEDDAKILAKPYSYNYVRRILAYNVNWMSSQVNILFACASLVKSTENEWYGSDINTVPENRRALVEVAASLLGKIPYEWGGKPHTAGWNTVWNNEGEGLDCSGYIEWVYWTYTGTRNAELSSTIDIVHNQQAIGYHELQIGDLGVESRSYVRYADYSGKVQSSYDAAVKANQAVGLGEEEVQKFSNHVGIYIGKDCAGRDLWIHCAGGSIGTVTITNCSDFAYFYRMPNMDTQ